MSEHLISYVFRMCCSTRAIPHHTGVKKNSRHEVLVLSPCSEITSEGTEPAFWGVKLQLSDWS